MRAIKKRWEGNGWEEKKRPENGEEEEKSNAPCESLWRARVRTRIINIFLLCSRIKKTVSCRDDEAQREAMHARKGAEGGVGWIEEFRASSDISVNLSAEP